MLLLKRSEEDINIVTENKINLVTMICNNIYFYILFCTRLGEQFHTQ